MGKKKAIMRKKVLSCFLIFVILMSLVPVSAFAAVNSNISSDGVDTASTDLTIEEVNAIIKSATAFILLDIRTEKDHRSGHIYGAMPIPLSELEDRAEGLDEKDRRIIVYDKNGVEGKIACDLLIQHGFENVYNMKGGINAWTEAGFPTVTYEFYKNTLTYQYKSLEPQLKAMSSHVIGFVDIVFIMDTSGSMDDEIETLCDNIPVIVSGIESRGHTVNYRILGLHNTWHCADQTVEDYVRQTGNSPVTNHKEDWGPGTQDISNYYDWRPSATRVIVPMSDEAPENGDSCSSSDSISITNAINAANRNNVYVCPIKCSGQSSCAQALADRLASETGGKAFSSTAPTEDLVDTIEKLLDVIIHKPVADAGSDQTVVVGSKVQFDGSRSYDPNGEIVGYRWDFDASDGVVKWASPDAYGACPNHTYTVAGIYNVSLMVRDNDEVADTDTVIISVVPDRISYLTPPDSAILSAKDVLFTWKTSLNSTTEIYIKAESETEFTRVGGQNNSDHAVTINNLSREASYTWYAQSCSVYGCTISDQRSFYIDRGIVFTRDRFDFTIERNYSQRVSVSVENRDTEAHDLLVMTSNPYDDLYYGFIGGGSADQIISLAPKETKEIALVIHAQDAMLEDYTFAVNLTNLGAENITDYALVHLHVPIPHIDYDITEVSTDPITMSKTIRITNRGDPVTDLSLTPDERLKGDVIIQPSLAHCSLRTGESVDIVISPIWSEGIRYIHGSVTATVADQSRELSVDYSCEVGKEMYEVTLNHPILYYDLRGAWCINCHHVEDVFNLPPGFVQENVVYAYIGMELAARSGQTRPYNVYIAVNGHPVGTLSNTFPRGYYEFDIDSSYLNYATAGTAENRYTLDTDMPGSYMTPLSNVRVVMCLDVLKLHICAESAEQAEEIAWSAPYIHKPSGSITVNVLSPEEGSPLNLNQPVLIKAEVLGNSGSEKRCTVKATFSCCDDEIALVDNGLHDDGQADDGVYANTWISEVVEVDSTKLTVNACNCIASGSDNINLQISTQYLNFEKIMDAIRSDSKKLVDDNTRAAAEVYTDGHNFCSEHHLPEGAFVSALAVIATAVQIYRGDVTSVRHVIAALAEYLGVTNIGIPGLKEAGKVQWQREGPGDFELAKGAATEVKNLNWMRNFEYTESVERAIEEGYKKRTNIYPNTISVIDNCFNDYINLAYPEPNERFDSSEVEAILEQQDEMLRGSTGFIITPEGDIYTLKETITHKSGYEGAKIIAETAGLTGAISTGIVVVGTAISVGTSWTIAGIGVGTIVSAFGAVGGLGSAFVETTAIELTKKEWGNTQLYWAKDLIKIQKVNTGISSWLNYEVQHPTDFKNIRGEIVSTDLHPNPLVKELLGINVIEPNQPWFSPLKVFALKDEDVVVRNTGSIDDVPIRVLNYNYQLGGATCKHGGVVRSTLDAGETQSVKLPYMSDFILPWMLEYHYLQTILWMDGKIIQKTDEYLVVPDIDWIIHPPLLFASSLTTENSTQERKEELMRQPMRSNSYALSTSNSNSPITLEEWISLVENCKKIIDTSLDPGNDSAKMQYTTKASITNVTFFMTTIPGVHLNLHVYDEIGRHVGYSPFIDSDQLQIPNATYTGNISNPEIIMIPNASSKNYTIKVDATQFTTSSPTPVEVYAIETPVRPAVLGISPVELYPFISPGESKNITIQLAELGKQVDIEDVTITPHEFTDIYGNLMPNITMSISSNNFDIDKGAETFVNLNFNASENITLPSVPETRYTGNVTINTSNAGEMNATLHVLLLDTDLLNAKLTFAESNVTGVHATSLNLSEINKTYKPTVIIPQSAYMVNSTGAGNFTLRLTDIPNANTITVYKINGTNHWIALDTFTTGNSVSFTMAVGDPRIVFASPEAIPPIITNVKPGNITAESDNVVEFNCTATDNIAVKSVLLNYTLNNWTSYYTKIMDNPYNDFYTTTLTLPLEAGALNYKIEAIDTAGNIGCSSIYTITALKGIVLFDESHDEIFSIAPNAKYSYSKLASFLKAKAYEVKALNSTPITKEKLTNCSIFVISAPKKPFDTNEVIAIREFVSNNGSLLLINEWGGDFRQGSNLNEIAENFGIVFNNDLVNNPTNNFHNTSTYALIHELSDHYITKGVNEFLYPAGCSLIANNSIARADDDSYTTLPKIPIQALAEEKPGTITVLAATNFEGGRVVCIGDGDFCGDLDIDGDGRANIDEYDNKKLTLNIVEWLAQREINELPVASFSYPPPQLFTNQAITFNASSSYDPDGSIENYSWEFGDGANGTGEIVTNSYSAAGIYNVTLTVTDDDGATNKKTKKIEVVLNATYVPDDYPKIQAAVDAASAGDMIIVRDGIYTENIDVNKRLIIKSENGAATTIVHAGNSNDHVFEVTADYVNLGGFTIEGAVGGDPLSAGIYLEADYCTIANNRIQNNYDGLCLRYSLNNHITSNNITDNTRHGIELDGDCNYNTIYGNSISLNEGGLSLDSSSNNEIYNNTINANRGYGGISFYSASRNNRIYLNNFINNSKNAITYYALSNVWNSPGKITYTYNSNTCTNYLGNYWHDYTGYDLNHDGIGDTVYIIYSERDNYPLIQQWEKYFG